MNFLRHQRSEKCWKLPSFDNYDQYETDYESDDSSDYQEFVLTEGCYIQGLAPGRAEILKNFIPGSGL